MDGNATPPRDDELAAPDIYKLDADWLRENFSGKTTSEAISMFEGRAAANYGDYFLFMSRKALAYYLPAALAYLESPASKGDGDFLDWITSSLSIRCQTDASLSAEIRELIRKIASYLKGHMQKFSCCAEHAPPDYLDRLDSMSISE